MHTKFIDLNAAADFLGPGAIEINRYQTEIFDIVRRRGVFGRGRRHWMTQDTFDHRRLGRGQIESDFRVPATVIFHRRDEVRAGVLGDVEYGEAAGHIVQPAVS